MNRVSRSLLSAYSFVRNCYSSSDMDGFSSTITAVAASIVVVSSDDVGTADPLSAISLEA